MRCPRCGATELDPGEHDSQGMTTCACGHRVYSGFVAEAEALSARLDWLGDRIRNGDPAPEPALLAQYRVWPPPGPRPSAGAAAPPPSAPGPERRAAPSVQTVLLGVGALLLVVAGAIFAAVVWDRLGAVGQVTLMVGATVAVGALAVRLRRRLAGTAEALALVAAGLATVDLLAAPALGLLPEEWLTDPSLYPAIAMAGLGVTLLALHHRFRLRAWSWFGWAAIPVAGGFVVAAVAAVTSNEAWIVAAVSVPALASIGMLAAASTATLHAQRVPMTVAGGLTLLVCALATASAALHRDPLLGALWTTAAAAMAMVAWSRRDDRRLVAWGACALVGVAAALLLALPGDPQGTWMAAVVAAAGLGLGLVLLRLRSDRTLALVAASCLWATWAVQRSSSTAELESAYDVSPQMSLLAGLVAIVAFSLATWLPWAAWVGAVLAMLALLVAPLPAPDQVEAYAWPFAVLLLLAGVLWHRARPGASLEWLGPAVTVALVPSALATWIAPWALGSASGSSTEHLARLAVVLVAGVVAVIVGARRRLGGLLIPGAAALVITATAQLWSGLAALPRWLGLGLAGVMLVVAGARIEWLRREGRRAVGWVEGLH